MLRLRAKACPSSGANGGEILYVRPHVEIPTRIGAEERKPYAQLRALGKKGQHAKS